MENKSLTDFLQKEPTWSIKNDALFRIIETNNWAESISIANLIGHLAEKYDHHPDLLISYSKIEISLSTHDLNIISDKDIQLATKIELALKI